MQCEDLVIQTDGGNIPIQQRNGVRQGSPDSPVLLAALMGEAAGPILARKGECTHPLPCSGSMYMDDTYLWAEPLSFLQSQVQQVEAALAKKIFFINGDKTECICSHPSPGSAITVGGQTVSVQGPTHAIKVLGATFTMGSSVSVLIATMQQKAKAMSKYHKATFRGNGTLAHKAALSDILTRPSALWGCGTWPCHAALLQAANTVQLRILRDSGGYARRPGETWSERNRRSLRMCRVYLHKAKHDRWSTFILRQIWQMQGHVARGCEMGRRLLAWEDLLWWQGEQRQRKGA